MQNSQNFMVLYMYILLWAELEIVWFVIPYIASFANLEFLPTPPSCCHLQSQEVCTVCTANNNLLHCTRFEVECKAFDNNGPQLSVRGQAHTHTLSLQAHVHTLCLCKHIHTLSLCGQALTLTHSSTAAGKKPNGLWASRGGRGRACKWSESRHMGGGWLLGQLGEFFRPKWVRFYPPTKKSIWNIARSKPICLHA